MVIDENIRFASISDLDGNMIESKNKKGLIFFCLLNLQKTLCHASYTWKSRMKHIDEIGGVLHIGSLLKITKSNYALIKRKNFVSNN